MMGNKWEGKRERKGVKGEGEVKGEGKETGKAMGMGTL
jgi:hypothetical protein